MRATPDEKVGFDGAAPFPAASQRNARIDCVRGVAILLVLLLHFALAYRLANLPLTAIVGMPAARAIFYNGNYGVTAFFVVSGYLITSMSMTRWRTLGNIDAVAFYVLRFARIFPPLLLALAVITVLGCAGLQYFSNTDGGHQLPAAYFLIAVGSVLTFWHNVLMQSDGWFNYCLNIYWSLSVEEVFYLALPIAFLALRNKTLFAVFCALLIAYAPVYRFQHAENELYWECGYLACFDAISAGCLTALAAQRWAIRGALARAVRVGAAIAFAAIYLWGIDGHEVYGFTLIAASVAAYLFAAVNDSAPGPASSRLAGPLRWLGRHSYELYLFHIIVLGLMRNILDRNDLPAAAWVPWLAVFLSVSALAAGAVANLVSNPANASLRHRYQHWQYANQMQRPGGQGVDES